VIVVDTSVAVKWLVEEEDSDRAAALLGRSLVAPDLILIECGNALWKRQRRGEIPFDQALAGLARLEQFVSLAPSAPFALRALEMAVELQHPVYDCLFLAAAERLDVMLVTADRRFYDAVARSARAGRITLLGEHD
jgi:predicted nucleic acid-binding protein